jgi:hypothetical protein
MKTLFKTLRNWFQWRKYRRNLRELDASLAPILTKDYVDDESVWEPLDMNNSKGSETF